METKLHEWSVFTGKVVYLVALLPLTNRIKHPRPTSLKEKIWRTSAQVCCRLITGYFCSHHLFPLDTPTRCISPRPPVLMDAICIYYAHYLRDCGSMWAGDIQHLRLLKQCERRGGDKAEAAGACQLLAWFWLRMKMKQMRHSSVVTNHVDNQLL